jgi:hypothetical protein
VKYFDLKRSRPQILLSYQALQELAYQAPNDQNLRARPTNPNRSGYCEG